MKPPCESVMNLRSKRHNSLSRAAHRILAAAHAAFFRTATISRLRRDLREKELQLLQQTAAARFTRRIFERSATAARMGVWYCSLPDNTLEWTDVIYDIFDLPQGSALRREDTIACYTADSLEKLLRLREAAIQSGEGFTMEAEIVTAKGNRRWIRITATVDRKGGVPTRIFGIKQDITEEKLLRERTEYLAAFDVMTGLANRAQFQSRLQEFCTADRMADRVSALMILDLDGFKQLNDTFGHADGDDTLKETARRLQEACAECTLIARIGGDEFAVLVDDVRDVTALREIAMRIVRTLYRRVTIDGCSVQLGASVGVAVFDASVDTVERLFKKADAALYDAKAAGRNTYSLYSENDARAERFASMPA